MRRISIAGVGTAFLKNADAQFRRTQNGALLWDGFAAEHNSQVPPNVLASVQSWRNELDGRGVVLAGHGSGGPLKGRYNNYGLRDDTTSVGTSSAPERAAVFGNESPVQGSFNQGEWLLSQLLRRAAAIQKPEHLVIEACNEDGCDVPWLATQALRMDGIDAPKLMTYSRAGRLGDALATSRAANRMLKARSESPPLFLPSFYNTDTSGKYIDRVVGGEKARLIISDKSQAVARVAPKYPNIGRNIEQAGVRLGKYIGAPFRGVGSAIDEIQNGDASAPSRVAYRYKLPQVAGGAAGAGLGAYIASKLDDAAGDVETRGPDAVASKEKLRKRRLNQLLGAAIGGLSGATLAHFIPHHNEEPSRVFEPAAK